MSHATEFFLNSIPAWHPSPSSPTSTRWCPTPPPYVIINTDRSSKGNLGMSGTGGVARLATGKWLWGFSLHLGCTNNTMAELWGIRETLLRAWDNGHRRVCDANLNRHALRTNQKKKKKTEYLPKKAKIHIFDRNPDPTFIIEMRTKGISVTL